MAVDLHIHSVWSDGTDTPYDIVMKAKSSGISTISVTDHDTTAGVAEAIMAGEQHGVMVIPGIEWSVVHEGFSFHMLGYFFDSQDPDLVEALAGIQDARIQRNENILKKLAVLGITISPEELASFSEKGQIGRPHIALALMKRGIVATIDQAFRKYLGRGCVAHVPRKPFAATQAIALVREAGGVAVLAHPGSTDPSLRRIPRLLEALAPVGLGGIEVYYPSHTKAMRRKLHEMARYYHLAVSGGSDYHGNNRPGTLADGQYLLVPDKVVELLKARL